MDQIHNKILRSLSRIRLDDDKDDIMDDIVTLFETVNNERGRLFGGRSNLLLAFRDDYLNTNGDDIFIMLSNRVTDTYADDRGATRQAVMNAAVANRPSEEDRQSTRETLRSRMSGFGGLSRR